METDTLPLRIVGTERECGIRISHHSVLSDAFLAESLPEGVRRQSSSGHMSNGMRYYIDHHGILEIATAEHEGPEDATYGDLAAEAFVIYSLTKLFENGDLDYFTLLASVVDELGNSWGHHENYLTAREAYDSDLMIPVISAHLATRSIFTGAGMWVPSRRDKARVVPAQKAHHIEKPVGKNTLEKKTLFNTRDEPHADEKLWARLHVITGDTNVSPWATWMKLGSTSIILHMIERGFVKPDELALQDPLAAMKAVASDPKLETKLELADRRRKPVKAVDVQERFVEQAEEMHEKFPLDPSEAKILKAWRSAVDDARKDIDLLEDRADWVQRSRTLHEAADEGVSRDRIKKINRWWEILATTQKPKEADKKPVIRQGWAVTRHRKAMRFEGFDEQRVEQLFSEPPKTRAFQRKKIVEKARALREFVEKVDWSIIKTNRHEHELPDPYGKIHRMKPR